MKNEGVWNEKYGDMLKMPHHISKNRCPMSRHNRAGQFAPFAALTGYEAFITETARLTKDMLCLDEDAVTCLDRTLQYIAANPQKHIPLTVTYFQPDAYKQGGSYVTVTDCIKRVDTVQGELKTESGLQIPIHHIVFLQCEENSCAATEE